MMHFTLLLPLCGKHILLIPGCALTIKGPTTPNGCCDTVERAKFERCSATWKVSDLSQVAFLSPSLLWHKIGTLIYPAELLQEYTLFVYTEWHNDKHRDQSRCTKQMWPVNKKCQGWFYTAGELTTANNLFWTHSEHMWWTQSSFFNVDHHSISQHMLEKSFVLLSLHFWISLKFSFWRMCWWGSGPASVWIIWRADMNSNENN